MNGSYTIRRARQDEREELLNLLNAAFSNKRVQMDFEKSHPYLFHQDRIPNHFICLDGDKLIGNIGVYAYPVRIGGEIFRCAGIGQVACLGEYRGRGVMSSILKEVCAELDRDLDFSWLYGDRLRYGRYGWVKGGRTLKFEMYDKYLPEPPEEGLIRSFDPGKDMELLKSHFGSLYVMPELTDRDLRELTAREDYTGYVLDGAFILVHTRFDTVEFASGDPGRIGHLLAH